MSYSKDAIEEYFTSNFKSRVSSSSVKSEPATSDCTLAQNDVSRLPIQIVHPTLRPDSETVSCRLFQPQIRNTSQKIAENSAHIAAMTYGTVPVTSNSVASTHTAVAPHRMYTVTPHNTNVVTSFASESVASATIVNQMTGSHDANHYREYANSSALSPVSSNMGSSTAYCVQRVRDARTWKHHTATKTNKPAGNLHKNEDDIKRSHVSKISNTEPTRISVDEKICSEPCAEKSTAEHVFSNDVDYRIHSSLSIEAAQPIAIIITADRSENRESLSPRTPCLLSIHICDMNDHAVTVNPSIPQIINGPVDGTKVETRLHTNNEDFTAFRNDVDMRKQLVFDASLPFVGNGPCSEKPKHCITNATCENNQNNEKICTNEAKEGASIITEQKADVTNCPSETSLVKRICCLKDVDLRGKLMCHAPTSYGDNVTEFQESEAECTVPGTFDSLSDINATQDVDLRVRCDFSESRTSIIPDVARETECTRCAHSEIRPDELQCDFNEVDVQYIEQQIRKIREEVDAWRTPLTPDSCRRRTGSGSGDDNHELIKRLRSNFYTEESDEDDDDAIDMTERNVIVSNTAYARDLDAIHVTFSSTI